MSDRRRIVLVGATGLIGSTTVGLTRGRSDFRLAAIARREIDLPYGARVEVFVADPANWRDVIADLRPHGVINALGTTWAKSGKDEAAFRAVDQDLVMAVAEAAKEGEVANFVSVSSVGADAMGKNFYLRVKGEVERDLTKLRFPRLDILRPGLLRGHRDGERRALERLGIIASPVTDLLLHGGMRAYRSIPAGVVARAALVLAQRKARGRFAHDNDAIRRAARDFSETVEG